MVGDPEGLARLRAADRSPRPTSRLRSTTAGKSRRRRGPSDAGAGARRRRLTPKAPDQRRVPKATPPRDDPAPRSGPAADALYPCETGSRSSSQRLAPAVARSAARSPPAGFPSALVRTASAAVSELASGAEGKDARAFSARFAALGCRYRRGLESLNIDAAGLSRTPPFFKELPRALPADLP